MTVLVGLTGGIGSGKSAVADRLRARGAVIVDADIVAREVVAPGQPAYGALVERFGPAVVAADGALDREAMAGIAFSDPAALADLNAITHPAIGAEMAARVAALGPADVVCVLVIPLLNAGHRHQLSLDAVVVVDCPTDVAVRRLVTLRRMRPEDARARVEAQIGREDRLALADYVVDNSAGLEALEEAVGALWAWLLARRAREG